MRGQLGEAGFEPARVLPQGILSPKNTPPCGALATVTPFFGALAGTEVYLDVPAWRRACHRSCHRLLQVALKTTQLRHSANWPKVGRCAFVGSLRAAAVGVRLLCGSMGNEVPKALGCAERGKRLWGHRLIPPARRSLHSPPLGRTRFTAVSPLRRETAFLASWAQNLGDAARSVKRRMLRARGYT